MPAPVAASTRSCPSWNDPARHAISASCCSRQEYPHGGRFSTASRQCRSATPFSRDRQAIRRTATGPSIVTTVVADFSRQPRPCPSAPASPGSGTSAPACASSASRSAPSPISRLASTAACSIPASVSAPAAAANRHATCTITRPSPAATASPAASSAAIAGSPPVAGQPAAYPSIRGFPSIGPVLANQDRTERKPHPHTDTPPPARNSRRKSHTHGT
jgi:hypothetical protein